MLASIIKIASWPRVAVGILAITSTLQGGVKGCTSKVSQFPLGAFLKPFFKVLFTFHIEFSWIYSQFPPLGILSIKKKGRICHSNFYKYSINTWKKEDISFI